MVFRDDIICREHLRTLQTLNVCRYWFVKAFSFKMFQLFRQQSSAGVADYIHGRMVFIKYDLVKGDVETIFELRYSEDVIFVSS